MFHLHLFEHLLFLAAIIYYDMILFMVIFCKILIIVIIIRVNTGYFVVTNKLVM